MFRKISTFITEVKGELKKATWPWDSDPKVKGFKKYKQLTDATLVVIVAMIFLAAFVGVWDLVNNEAVSFTLRLINK